MRVFEDGDHLHGAVMTALAKLWPTGTAVLSGCEISGSPSALVVSIGAGSVSINGVVVSVGADTASLSAAGVFDRYDIICVDTGGDLVVVDGTDERVVPSIPADTVPVAICLVEIGQSTLPADRVQDIRVLATHVVSDRLTARLVGRSNLFTIVTASDNIKASDDTVGGTTGNTPTKVREFQMGVNLHATTVQPVVRVWFDIRATGEGTSVSGSVRINGVSTSVTGSTTNMSFQTIAGDIAVKAGDLVQLYVSHSGDNAGQYRNFRIGFDVEEIVLTPELVITQTL